MSNLNQVASAAGRVKLVVVSDGVSKELYGIAVPALDEVATLRRVVLFYRGTGSYVLSPEERRAAVEVLRGRFEERLWGR